jgi:hypothetical protein
VLAEATSTWQLGALIEGVSMQGSVRAGPQQLSPIIRGLIREGRVSRDLKDIFRTNGARYGKVCIQD